MEKAMTRDHIVVNDRQLACAHINSKEGQDYLKGMFAAGNYAWVNRSSMTFLTRQVTIARCVAHGFLSIVKITAKLLCCDVRAKFTLRIAQWCFRFLRKFCFEARLGQFPKKDPRCKLLSSPRRRF